MKAKKISTERAKQDKLFYVVANVVVFRASDERCLLLKRHEREKAHPGKYATPGGKLEWSNFDLNHPTRMNGDIYDFEGAIEDLLIRETKEEAGIDTHDDFTYLESIGFVRPDGIPVMLLKFAGKYKSGEVTLEKHSFSDYAWVNATEVHEYNTIDGIPREVKKTIALYKKD